MSRSRRPWERSFPWEWEWKEQRKQSLSISIPNVPGIFGKAQVIVMIVVSGFPEITPSTKGRRLGTPSPRWERRTECGRSTSQATITLVPSAAHSSVHATLCATYLIDPVKTGSIVSNWRHATDAPRSKIAMRGTVNRTAAPWIRMNKLQRKRVGETMWLRSLTTRKCVPVLHRSKPH